MRAENQRMKAFLAANGIDATPKYLKDGSLKHTWRLCNLKTVWTESLAARLNKLGFQDYNGMPLDKFSGNDGVFQVFVRGHYELLK